jgi:hypothetical protein
MSFSLQGSQIRASLVGAGLPADAASAIANILGNAVQGLRHAGEVKIDRTPRNMRMVTPDERRHSLQNLDFRAGDPDYRQAQTQLGERRREPEPEPAVLVDRAPQRDAAPFRVAGGAYTETQAQGDAVRVDLRLRGAGECAFIEPRANTLVGKHLRAEAGGGDEGRLRFFVDQTDREAVWKLQLINVQKVRVVSDITYEQGRGLVVSYRDVEAWSYSKPFIEVIPVVQQRLVSGVTLGDDGILITSAVVDVLGAAEGASGLIETDDCPEGPSS